MESVKDEENTESGSAESQPPPARVKIRDLRPEKDPMGAGLGRAPQSVAQNRWPSAD